MEKDKSDAVLFKLNYPILAHFMTANFAVMLINRQRLDLRLNIILGLSRPKMLLLLIHLRLRLRLGFRLRRR